MKYPGISEDIKNCSDGYPDISISSPNPDCKHVRLSEKYSDVRLFCSSNFIIYLLFWYQFMCTGNSI